MQIYFNPTSNQCFCRICDFQWWHTAVYPLPRKESESWPERSNGWPHCSGPFPHLSSLCPRSTSFPEFEARRDSGPAFAAGWGRPSSSRRIGRAFCRPRCSRGRTLVKIIVHRIPSKNTIAQKISTWPTFERNPTIRFSPAIVTSIFDDPGNRFLSQRGLSPGFAPDRLRHHEFVVVAHDVVCICCNRFLLSRLKDSTLQFGTTTYILITSL